MSTAWVLNKGAISDGTATTFVPQGTVLVMYGGVNPADLGEEGLLPLASDDSKAFFYTGPEEVPNYALTAFGSADATKAMAAASSEISGRVLGVGADLDADIALCSDPTVCTAP